MGRLLNYFQGPKIDSEGQLRAAREKAKSYTPEQEARARAAGFKSADEMVLFMKNRQRGLRQTDTVRSRLSLDDALAGHPMNTIGRAASEVQRVNERMRR